MSPRNYGQGIVFQGVHRIPRRVSPSDSVGIGMSRGHEQRSNHGKQLEDIA